MKKDDTRRDSNGSGNSGDAGESGTLAAVSALMDERRRYEGWIATLEARRASTPEHVFARVNADYTARLEAVISQLTTHTEGLRQEMESLTSRLGGLRDERQRAEDERAEAELRAHVGELSSGDWEKTAAESDARLAGLSARHGDVEQELAKTRDLLDSAQRPATPSASIAAAAPSASVAPAPAEPAAPAAPIPEPARAPVAEPRRSGARPAAASAPESAAPPGAPQAAVAPAPRASPFRVIHQTPSPGMLPIEQHALDMDEAPPAPPSALPELPSQRTSSPPRKSSFDELAFLSSVVDTPSGSIEPAPTDEPDERTRRDTFARRSQEESVVNLTESGSVPLVTPLGEQPQREADSVLSRSGRTADAVSGRDSLDGTKTLKCSECGSMNYPTEWYCERCGAELASL